MHELEPTLGRPLWPLPPRCRLARLEGQREGMICPHPRRGPPGYADRADRTPSGTSGALARGWHTALVTERGRAPSVQDVFSELRRRLPEVAIERLAVKYPADDDNLWFIRTEAEKDIQIASHPDGRPPFLIEGDSLNQRHETSELDDAVATILAWLGPS